MGGGGHIVFVPFPTGIDWLVNRVRQREDIDTYYLIKFLLVAWDQTPSSDKVVSAVLSMRKIS